MKSTVGLFLLSKRKSNNGKPKGQFLIKDRGSSHRRCSLKKGVLRNFAKFTGKHPCQRIFLNKVEGLTSF